jgi:hypothetical protein
MGFGNNSEKTPMTRSMKIAVCGLIHHLEDPLLTGNSRVT